MGRYSRLREIRRMDPERDFEQIFRWITQYEFPWDYQQGVSIAFLRDYGVPRISRLLDRTQEFEKAGQALQRSPASPSPCSVSRCCAPSASRASPHGWSSWPSDSSGRAPPMYG